MGGIRLILLAVLAQFALALPEALVASYVAQLYHNEDLDINMAIELDYSSGVYLSSSSSSDTYKKDKIKEHKSKDKYKETTVSYNNGYNSGYNSGPTIVIGPSGPSYGPSYVDSYYYGVSWATIIIGGIIIVLAAAVMVFFEKKVKARNRVF